MDDTLVKRLQRMPGNQVRVLSYHLAYQPFTLALGGDGNGVAIRGAGGMVREEDVMWRTLAVQVLVAGFVVGCNNASLPTQESAELPLPVSERLSPHAKKLITECWPKVNKACPGLKKYSQCLKVVEVSENLVPDDLEYEKVTVEVKVPDEASEIPRDYHALGNHCFLEIAPDGTSVAVTKRACVAVFLDKPFDVNGGMVTVPLL